MASVRAVSTILPRYITRSRKSKAVYMRRKEFQRAYASRLPPKILAIANSNSVLWRRANPLHASMHRPTAQLLLRGEGTCDISDKIVGMFNANRYSDQSRRNPDGAPCFFRQPGMHRRRRVTNQ